MPRCGLMLDLCDGAGLDLTPGQLSLFRVD